MQQFQSRTIQHLQWEEIFQQARSFPRVTMYWTMQALLARVVPLFSIHFNTEENLSQFSPINQIYIYIYIVGQINSGMTTYLNAMLISKLFSLINFWRRNLIVVVDQEKNQKIECCR